MARHNCMKRRLTRWGLGGVLASAIHVHAHEHWIDLDSFYPVVGATVGVHVRSGHYFPRSALKLSEKVMQAVSVHRPDGPALDLDPAAGDSEWAGVLTPRQQGVHMVTFALKRPRAATPNYEAKAILVVGPGEDLPARYALGSGLELIPAAGVSSLRPGGQVPVSLCLDGEIIEAELSVVPERGRSTTVKVGPGEPALVSLREAGRYLVSASVKGRGCSLVFQVRSPEEASP